jgi:hypothetical protein
MTWQDKRRDNMMANFRTATIAALNDPATRLQGAMIAQHPVDGGWDYFIAGTPAHDAVDGDIIKYDTMPGYGYQTVFISQELATNWYFNEDDDGNEIDREIFVDQIEVGIIL